MASFLLQRRPSEPLGLYMGKLFFYIAIYLAILGFFATLCLKVQQDHSAIQQSRDFPSKIVAPNIQFNAPFTYNLSCKILYTDPTRNDPTGNDCSPNYIMQPKIDNDTNYYGFFYGTLYFSGFALADIDEIQINVTTSNNQSTVPMEFRLYDADPEFENIQPYTDGVRNPPDNLNFYHLISGQTHFVSYRRFRNDTLIDSWRNTLGVPPTAWNHEFFMTSNFERIPGNPNPTLYAFVRMTLQSTEVDNITEVKGSTILSALSLVGGALSLGLGLYTCVFGPQTPQPWGAIQHVPGIRQIVNHRLENKYGQPVPLSIESINRSATTPNIAIHDLPTNQLNQLSILERVQVLEQFQHQLVGYHRHLMNFQNSLDKRQSNIELFLREYVIDAEFLDGIPTTFVQNGNSFTESQQPQTTQYEYPRENQSNQPQYGYNFEQYPKGVATDK